MRAAKVIGALVAAAAFSVAAAHGCDVALSLQEPSGRPAPNRLVVKIQDQGRATTHEWSGSELRLQNLTCGPLPYEVGTEQLQAGSVTWRTVAAGTFNSSEGPAVTIRVPVLRSVVVRALDERDQPVPGGSVTIQPVGWPAQGSRPRGLVAANVGDDGTLLHLAEPATYQLTYRAPFGSVLRARVDGREVGPGAIDVTVQDGTTTVDLVVSAGVLVRGTVADDQGAPVTGVVLDVQSSQGVDSARWAGTDGQGAFAGFVDALPVTIRPRDDAGEYAFEPPSVTVDSEEDAANVRLTARRDAGSRLRARVSGPDGEAVAGAQVTLQVAVPHTLPLAAPRADFFRTEGTQAATKPDGTVSLRCVPGAAAHISVDPAPGRYFGRNVSIDALRCDAPQEIVLERGATVSGVVRTKDGRALPGFALELRRDAGGRAILVTDGSGHFASSALQPGWYSIRNARSRNAGSLKGLAVELADRVRGSDDRNGFRLDSGDLELQVKAYPGAMVCVRAQDPEGAVVWPFALELLRASDRREIAAAGPDGSAPPEPDSRMCVGPVGAGEYLLRVGAMTGGFIPVWWPGVEDEALAAEIEVKQGRDASLGPMRVRPAGSVRATFSGRAPVDERLVVEIAAATGDEADKWNVHPSSRVFVRREDRRGEDPRSEEVLIHGVPVGAWKVRLCEEPAPAGCSGRDFWFGAETASVKRGGTTTVSLRAHADTTIGLPPGWTPDFTIYAASNDCVAVSLESESGYRVYQLRGNLVVQTNVLSNISHMEYSANASHLLVSYVYEGKRRWSLIDAAGAIVWTKTDHRIYEFSTTGERIFAWDSTDLGVRGRASMFDLNGVHSREWDLGGPWVDAMLVGTGDRVLLASSLGVTCIDQSAAQVWELSFNGDDDARITGIRALGGLLLINQHWGQFKLANIASGALVYNYDPYLLGGGVLEAAREHMRYSASLGVAPGTVLLINLNLPADNGRLLTLSSGAIQPHPIDVSTPPGFTLLPYTRDRKLIMMSGTQLRIREIN